MDFKNSMIMGASTENRNFLAVTEKWGKLQYMNEARGECMRSLIVESDCKDLLEIGFFKGKSSAYFAAILEDLGRGHLTTIDRKLANKRTPNITTVLKDLKLTHRVTPIFSHRSHTWEMAKMLKTDPRPQFDFCYFDGGHTWDVTGFGILLVDMLLKPGGVLVVDDLNWTINGSLKYNPDGTKFYATYDDEERACESVRLAWQTIVPHLGYEDLKVEQAFNWGIARKPL